MKILSTTQQLDKELKRLLNSYSKYSWAIAWGSISYKDGFKLLKKNKDNIKRMVVGIHFYQTHPDFISEFINLQSVKFVMNPDGVFHPKVYLFESNNGDWECIIGSPNFTGSAFTINSEVAVLLSSKDNDAGVAFQNLTNVLEKYWERGVYLKNKELISYRDLWKRKQKPLNLVSGQYGGSKKVKRSPLDVDIFKMSWKDFFHEVKDDQEHSLLGRIEVLNAAKNLFESHKHFNDMNVEDKRGIAGFGPEEEIHWHWFGSTVPAGNFKQAINNENQYISMALDKIPLHGDVTKNHYRAFVNEFSEVDGGGIATATRLLSMKRPDYFLCLNSKNKDNLCTKFAIPKNIDLLDYWDVVIERVIDCVWWASEKPTDQLEVAVWNYRVAFLDALFYDPS